MKKLSNKIIAGAITGFVGILIATSLLVVGLELTVIYIIASLCFGAVMTLVYNLVKDHLDVNDNRRGE